MSQATLQGRGFPMAALVRRELLMQLRRTRSLVWFLLLAAVTVLIVIGNWPRSNTPIIWSQLSGSTQGLLYSFSFLFLIASALFVPGIAATSIVVEKQQRSWDLMRLTLIRTTGITLGKLLSAVSLYILYVLALVPVLGVMFFLIGVDWIQVLLPMMLVLITSISCGMAGVAASTWFRRTVTCIVFSYLGMLIVMGLPVLFVGLIFMILEQNGISVQSRLPFDIELLFGISPLPMVFFAASGQLSSIATFGVSPASVIAVHAGYQLLLILTAFALAIAGLRRRGSLVPKTLRSRSRVDRDPSVPSKSWRRRLAGRPHKPIPDGQNPVYAREVRWGLLPRLVGIRRFFYPGALFLAFFTLTIFLLYTTTQGISLRDVGQASVFVHGIIIACFVPTFLANTYAKEFEGNHWDAIRMSLVLPKQIVAGKFRAGLRIVFMVVGISFVANSLIGWLVYLDGRSVFPIVTGHLSILVTALSCLCTTLCASVIARKTSTAVVLSYLFSYIGLFGVMTLMGILAIAFRLNFDWDDPLGYLMFYTSPVAAYGIMVTTVDRDPEILFHYLLHLVLFLTFYVALYSLAKTLFENRVYRRV